MAKKEQSETRPAILTYGKITRRGREKGGTYNVVCVRQLLLLLQHEGFLKKLDKQREAV
jgi:hypothetical protein